MPFFPLGMSMKQSAEYGQTALKTKGLHLITGIRNNKKHTMMSMEEKTVVEQKGHYRVGV
jgi:hypothetical protein